MDKHSIAYHEAGHTATSIFLGFEQIKTSIVKQVAEKRIVEGVSFQLHPDVINGKPLPWHSNMTESVNDILTVLVSGYIAERIYNGKSHPAPLKLKTVNDDDFGAANDYNEALNLIKNFFPESTYWSKIDDVQNHAIQLVYGLWSQISVMANLLVEFGTIEKDDLRNIFTKVTEKICEQSPVRGSK